MKSCGIYIKRGIGIVSKVCKEIFGMKTHSCPRLILLEDQYGERIAQEILSLDRSISLPIQENIKNPLKYVDFIRENDIILLDNYFPGKGWEEPLGNDFLLELLKTGKNYRIICISDRGKRLIEWYDGWKEANEKGWIKGWVQNKNGGDIVSLIKITPS